LKTPDKFKSLSINDSLNYRLKSEIKMNKRKLIQIIEKELEELKVISEEVSESENDNYLVIDIALSKARLLCQEIELLRELTVTPVAMNENDSPEENEEEQIGVNEDEGTDVNISDPELEIVDFDDQASNDEDKNSDNEEEEPDSQKSEIGSEDSDSDQGENEEEPEDEKIEEELIEFGGRNNEKEEKPQPKSAIEHTIEHTEQKIDRQPHFAGHPVMREIPKPEEQILEKKVVVESPKKERSLNDSIGENKPTEPTVTTGAISSLRTAIGLNDRFLFIREIFGNNTDKYNTVIDKLDKLETIQQAVDYLKANLTLQKNETSMKFVDLLKRRFSK
jgi:hypothetical protein